MYAFTGMYLGEYFRPLTGINFNSFGTRNRRRKTFPSPHGDKFQLLHLGEDEKVVLFPSPHGDKFQQVTSIILDSLFEFPSPHGDKFQQKERLRLP